MTTATGGNMRWEIIQNAMSSLPKPRLKRRATVCGHRAEQDGDGRAGEPDDHGVEVRPERVLTKVEEDVVPGVERRLEVAPRDIERPAVDREGRLERGHGQPVEREQDHERPGEESDV